MNDQKEKSGYIKLELPGGLKQTEPVAPEKRLQADDITISLCTADDSMDLAAGLYAAFPPTFWDRKEPLDQRPPEQLTRQTRLANRLRPTFLNPDFKWIKATLTSTGEMIGAACWTAPGAPIHSHFRKTAADFYGWREKLGWTDEEFEEMWKGVDLEAWDGQFAKDDDIRAEIMGEEGHWWLAPLMTFPGYQGRGVGTRLLNWAFEQADKTTPVTPCYLESAPTARAVYMHWGFVPCGEYNMVRRGPRVQGDMVEKVEIKGFEKKVESTEEVV